MTTNSENSVYPIVFKDLVYDNGLTKLEYFAAMAMQGILSKPGIYETFEVITECSVICAEKLIKELNKK